MAEATPRPLGAHVMDLALAPWALTPGMVAMVAAIIARRVAGRADDHAWALDRRPVASVPPKAHAVAVIPLHGVMMPRASMFSDISGATSYDQAAADVRAAADDPDIGTIVLDMNTPGGTTSGIVGLARTVLAARAKKPVIAQVEHQACSAGYWIAACATEISAAPLSIVGSIGVYAIHENLAAALEKEGVAITFISAGKYKVEGNETGPLSEDAYAHRKALIDEAYGAFVADIAKGRGVPEALVRSSYGEGRVLSADMALAAGMVDRIATLDDTLSRLTHRDTAAPATADATASATAHTSQEPAKVTDQDRHADVTFANAFEADLFALRVQ